MMNGFSEVEAMCPEALYMKIEAPDSSYCGDFNQNKDYSLTDLDHQTPENNTVAYTQLGTADLVTQGTGDQWHFHQPHTWDEIMVSHWLYHLQENVICSATFNPQSLAGLNGATLMQMTYEDFCNRDPIYGVFVWRAFDSMRQTYNTHMVQPQLANLTQQENIPMDERIASLTHSMKELMFDIDVNDKFTSIKTSTPMQSVLQYNYQHQQQNYQAPLERVKTEPTSSIEVFLPRDADSDNSTGSYSEGETQANLNSDHDSGHHSGDSGSESPQKCFKKQKDGRKQGKRTRKESASTQPRLYKFILELLESPAYNPEIIRWEDKDDRIFRVVASQRVAQLWGERKGNATMTYEKMARALRYTRKEGHLIDMPAGSLHPKKLCFRFSDRHVPN